MAQVVVLGGGFGGLAAAHELRRILPSDDEIVLVAREDRFFAGFAKLWDLVGARPLAQGTASLGGLERHGIRYVHAEVTGVDADERTAETTQGSLTGDGLVIALGAGYAPAHTAMLGPGAHNLYDATALPAIRAELETLEEGRLVVSILGVPYLCPPAPFEAALLLDEWLRERGRRPAVEVVISTPQPLSLPVAGPDASRYLTERLEERGITVLTAHEVEAVDHDARALRFRDAAPLPWQLLLGVPAAAPPTALASTALAGSSGWIEPDPRTFRTGATNVYAVGDCTMVPTATAQLPKAGVFAEAAGQVAARNLAADLHGGQQAAFDGHGYCFLELPGQRAAMVTGDFYAQPRPQVVLTSPDEDAYRAKQRWEQERLTSWLG